MTTPPQDLHPSVLDRFRAAAEETLTESKDAATTRDALDRDIAEAATQDKEDERLEALAVRELEQIRARRGERAQSMAQRLTTRATADADAQRLEADGRRALAWIDQMAKDDTAPPEAPPAGQPVQGMQPMRALGDALTTRVDGQVQP